MHSNDKRPLNEQRQAHGLWEVYYQSGELHFKGFFVNGLAHGKYISYYQDGTLQLNAYLFHNSVYGYCEHRQQILYYAN